MSSEPSMYSGLKLLPAALEILDLARDPLLPRDAVTIETVERRSARGPWTEPVATIRWDAYRDPGLSTTCQQLARIARSLLDDAPVDLRALAHLDADTGRRLAGALAAAWDEAR
jgi:hypothetical protein